MVGVLLTYLTVYSPSSIEVAWDTSFEQLEALRARMLAFVKEERRDYQPVFDVIVDSEYTPICVKMTFPSSFCRLLRSVQDKCKGRHQI